MRKLLCFIAFIGILYGQANAQSYASGSYEIKPNPAFEGQMVTIGFLTGCRHWEDHNFEVNGFVIDYEVLYYDCLVGVPTPEYYEYFDLGVLPAGNYQVNMSIGFADVSPIIVLEETITFGVLPSQQVPLNSNLIYLFLGFLLLLTGIFTIRVLRPNV